MVFDSKSCKIHLQSRVSYCFYNPNLTIQFNKMTHQFFFPIICESINTRHQFLFSTETGKSADPLFSVPIVFRHPFLARLLLLLHGPRFIVRELGQFIHRLVVRNHIPARYRLETVSGLRHRVFEKVNKINNKISPVFIEELHLIIPKVLRLADVQRIFSVLKLNDRFVRITNRHIIVYDKT